MLSSEHKKQLLERHDSCHIFVSRQAILVIIVHSSPTIGLHAAKMRKYYSSAKCIVNYSLGVKAAT